MTIASRGVLRLTPPHRLTYVCSDLRTASVASSSQLQQHTNTCKLHCFSLYTVFNSASSSYLMVPLTRDFSRSEGPSLCSGLPSQTNYLHLCDQWTQYYKHFDTKWRRTCSSSKCSSTSATMTMLQRWKIEVSGDILFWYLINCNYCTVCY